MSRRTVIPAELRELDQWVGWKLERRPGEPKPTKPPYTADGSRKASCSDPSTWAPFEVVCAGVDSGKIDGVGFQVKETDPYVGIDLDGCCTLATGAIAPWAQAIVARYGSYTEISPSDTGLRIFIKATKPGPRCRKGDLEIYNRDRYLTVTGRHLPGTPLTIEERQEELDAHYAELFPATQPSALNGAVHRVETLTAYEILDHARRASNAARWDSLMRGDPSEYGGDESRADAALCALAAFYTRDPSTIDQIVRMSGLCRPKWTDRVDYRDRTIAGALQLVHETYEPGEVRGLAAGGQLTSPPALPVATPWPDAPAAEAFHGLAGDVVGAIDPHTEADPVAVLVGFLTAFGNIIDSGPHAVVGSTHHSARIFAALVGETARARKGDSWSAVRRLMASAAPEWAEGRVQGGLSSGEGLIAAVRDPVEQTDRKTGEASVVDAGISDKRLLVVEPELARTLRVMHRDGSTLSTILRDAWDTGTLRVMTKTPARASGAHVSALGHITVEELRRELDETSLANGFANRFLWLAVRRSKLLAEPEPFAGPKVEALAQRIRSALDFAGTIDQVERDDEARVVWRTVYPDLTADRPGMLGSVLNRCEAHAVRLSLIYALLDRSPIIRRVHLHAALALLDYVEASARFIFAGRLGDPVADAILHLLATSPSHAMSRAELYDSFGRHTRRERLSDALSALVAAGRVAVTRAETGGRPTEMVTLT